MRPFQNGGVAQVLAEHRLFVPPSPKDDVEVSFFFAKQKPREVCDVRLTVGFGQHFLPVASEWRTCLVP